MGAIIIELFSSTRIQSSQKHNVCWQDIAHKIYEIPLAPFIRGLVFIIYWAEVNMRGVGLWQVSPLTTLCLSDLSPPLGKHRHQCHHHPYNGDDGKMYLTSPFYSRQITFWQLVCVTQKTKYLWMWVVIWAEDRPGPSLSYLILCRPDKYNRHSGLRAANRRIEWNVLKKENWLDQHFWNV